MLFKRNKNFCDINPFFYSISMYKGILLRKIKDLLSKEKFAKVREEKKLPNVVYEYSSTIIKEGKDIDPKTQENKAVNIRLASSKITGIVIHPGEIFSFWRISLFRLLEIPTFVLNSNTSPANVTLTFISPKTTLAKGSFANEFLFTFMPISFSYEHSIKCLA